MPLLLDTARSSRTVELRGNAISIGLVNNMPDAALEATERQFVDLIRATTAKAVVYLKLFSIPEVPRADNVRRALAGRYRDISELWDTRLDGLIVTGTEPRAERLSDEPYWTTLSNIVDWARENTTSTIFSCLAAHAAVLHADGIERRPLVQKCFGVFDCDVLAAHALTKDLGPRLLVPHSRYNDLPEQALVASGYRVLTRSDAAGVDLFARQEGDHRSLFLFLQGHPEYEAGTLLREYRRDVARFLRGEREHYPTDPLGYFGDAVEKILSEFRARASRNRSEDLIADFPMSILEASLEGRWRGSAANIYENWLCYLSRRKTVGRAKILNDTAREAGRLAEPKAADG